jgi:hypothetical protein
MQTMVDWRKEVPEYFEQYYCRIQFRKKEIISKSQMPSYPSEDA